ncbi:MAG: cellulase family glycosylhydrolase [Gammaproteobacteria bacterium]|nr:cellulase family glycosylhydrolase [Gammaproteobacteria bacterium]
MSRIWCNFIAFCFLSFTFACKPGVVENNKFVSIQDGLFRVDGKNYRYVGTNFWYGAYLGVEGEGGDRQRLLKELDFMKANGIINLRVLAASEKSNLQMALRPAIQTAPGKYNEQILRGLDFLLMEMAKRDMKAVLFLNNFWQWSSGMPQYVSWVTGEDVIDPDLTGKWNEFMQQSARFYRLPEAQKIYKDFISMLVNRTNTYTGVTYKDDPTIMAWELANEPRHGGYNGGWDNHEVFKKWIADTAAYIHSIDMNHLVTSGSEGSAGTLDDMALFIDTHSTEYIDYLTFHLWIKNWGWFDINKPNETYEHALARSLKYINDHIDVANEMKKPIVFEEFGVERDNGDYRITSTTIYRDKFLKEFYGLCYKRAVEGSAVGGTNVWTWGGYGRSDRKEFIWQEGDPFLGDPPQEAQGLNSIFDVDRSTLKIIKEHAEKLQVLAK